MDGRNRINAIMKLDLDLKALELSDCTYDEAVAFARSKNDHRRHMAPSQIAMRAAKEIWQSRFNEDATKKPRPQWLKVPEHRDVADKKISVTTVEAAIRILKDYPKYAEEIFTGERSIQQVVNILKKNKNTESFIAAQAEAFHKEVNDDTFHYENGEIKPRNLVYADKTLSYLETEYSEDTAIRYTKYTKEHTIEELAKMLVELEEQLDEVKSK